MQRKQVVNWKGVVFWGVILGLLGLAVYIYRFTIIAFLNSLPSKIGSLQIPDFTGFFDGIIKYINENPIPVILGTVSACAAVGGFAKSIVDSRAKAQALLEKEQAEQVATQTINASQREALEYKAKYEELQKTAGSSEALLETQNIVSEKNAEIKELKTKYGELLSFVESQNEAAVIQKLKEKGVIKEPVP